MGARDVLTDAAVRNAMVVHAAFGGSTNLLIHLPAIAFSAGLQRPTVEDWAAVNRQTPRLVDALPNGPRGFATVQVFLAGGVPEAMLHLRQGGAAGHERAHGERRNAGRVPGLVGAKRAAARVARRAQARGLDRCRRCDHERGPGAGAGVDADRMFPDGESCTGRWSVIKSTAIDPSLIDENNVYRHSGPAKVFVREEAAIEAIKSGRVAHGDVVVLICCGPKGAGMPETYQVTSALKMLPHCKHVAVITDARFSGVSTGACIGHVSPEALARGPVGKVRDGDWIEIVIDRERLTGTVNLIGDAEGRRFDAAEGARLLKERAPRGDLAPHPALPEDTRLWAALVEVSGGVWGGCVYDAEKIVRALESGGAHS